MQFSGITQLLEKLHANLHISVLGTQAECDPVTRTCLWLEEEALGSGASPKWGEVGLH